MPPPDPDDDPARDHAELAKATTVLLAFAAAMAQWERACAAQARQRPLEQLDRNEVHELHDAQRASCQAIFDRYCTDRPRGNARPAVPHYADPSDYDPNHFRIEQIAFNKSRRIEAETAAAPPTRYRFTLVKKKDAWRIDQREACANGAWTSTSL